MAEEEYGGEEEEEMEMDNMQVVALASIILMMILLTILFEKMKHHVLEHTDREYSKPIIEALFGEMTTLGFLSLLVFSLNESGFFELWNEKLFKNDDPEDLILLVEHAHYAIFFIMVFFVLEVTIMVRESMDMEKKWDQMEQLTRDTTTLRAMVHAVEHKNTPMTIIPTTTEMTTNGAEVGVCGNNADNNEHDEHEKHKQQRRFFQRALHPLRSFFILRSHRYESFETDAILYYGLRREFLLERSLEYPFEPMKSDQRVPDNFHFARYLTHCLGKTMAQVVSIQDETWLLFAVVTVAFGGLAVLLESNLLILAWVWVGIAWLVFLCNVYFEYHLLVVRRAYIGDQLPKELRSDNSGPSTATTSTTADNDHNEDIDDLPGWARLDMTEYESGRWTAMAPNNENGKAPTNRQQALFWFGPHGPKLYTIILQATLVFSGANAGMLILAFVPQVYKAHSTWWLVLYLVLALTPSVGIFANKKHVAATMTQVCSMGSLRKPQVIADVQREEKTKDVVRTFFVWYKLRRFAADMGSSSAISMSKLRHQWALSTLERQEVLKAFRAMDRDGDGEISIDEFRTLFGNLGTQLPEARLQALFDMLDADKDGTVTDEEFLNWYANFMGDEDVSIKQCADDIFSQFDTSNSGEIMLGQFNRQLSAMNVGFTLDEVGDLVQELDHDHNGKVGRHEFRALVEKYYPRELTSLRSASSRGFAA